MHDAADAERAPPSMTDTPTLSIVVVNWNTRELLLQLLRRLFDAPRLPFEVLVVDNQSADGSADGIPSGSPPADGSRELSTSKGSQPPTPRAVPWSWVPFEGFMPPNFVTNNGFLCPHKS